MIEPTEHAVLHDGHRHHRRFAISAGVGGLSVRNEDIAEAFSRHRFAETYGHLAADVSWVTHGGPALAGKDAVVAACEESGAYLADVRTQFRSFRTIVGSDVVVIESVASYSDADGETVVASCDLYDFADGQLVTITSYTVDVTPGSSDR